MKDRLREPSPMGGIGLIATGIASLYHMTTQQAQPKLLQV